jgi:hypothetical protein
LIVGRYPYGYIASFALIALASTFTSVALVYQPRALAALAVMIVLVLALWHPRSLLVAVIVGCALYEGIYLNYRISVASLPLSALDLFPVIALIAGYSIRSRSARTPISPSGSTALGLLSIGFVTGCVLGLANHAAFAQWAKVDRVEFELLVTLVAALVAGSTPAWRRALVTGLYVAAAIAAVLQIGSFAYATGFHHPLWSSFSFGATNVANLTDSLTPDRIAATRDNYLPTFIMLPGLALALYRLRRVDVVLIVAVVIATAMCLSRAMWLAAGITIIIALLARFASGRPLHTGATIGLIAGAALALFVVGDIGGNILAARVAGSFGGSDISLIRRQSETDEAFARLRSTPFTFVAGLGAGSFIPAIHEAAPTPILEDQLLAKWTNFGLVSVIGTIWLLLFGGVAAFHALRRRTSLDTDVMALGLCLPAIVIVSIFSGTLLELNVSFPLWLLAGTVYASARAGKQQRVAATAVDPL